MISTHNRTTIWLRKFHVWPDVFCILLPVSSHVPVDSFRSKSMSLGRPLHCLATPFKFHKVELWSRLRMIIIDVLIRPSWSAELFLIFLEMHNLVKILHSYNGFTSDQTDNSHSCPEQRHCSSQHRRRKSRYFWNPLSRQNIPMSISRLCAWPVWLTCSSASRQRLSLISTPSIMLQSAQESSSKSTTMPCMMPNYSIRMKGIFKFSFDWARNINSL